MFVYSTKTPNLEIVGKTFCDLLHFILLSLQLNDYNQNIFQMISTWYCDLQYVLQKTCATTEKTKSTHLGCPSVHGAILWVHSWNGRHERCWHGNSMGCCLNSIHIVGTVMVMCGHSRMEMQGLKSLMYKLKFQKWCFNQNAMAIRFFFQFMTA